MDPRVLHRDRLVLSSVMHGSSSRLHVNSSDFASYEDHLCRLTRPNVTLFPYAPDKIHCTAPTLQSLLLYNGSDAADSRLSLHTYCPPSSPHGNFLAVLHKTVPVDHSMVTRIPRTRRSPVPLCHKRSTNVPVRYSGRKVGARFSDSRMSVATLSTCLFVLLPLTTPTSTASTG